MMWNPALLTAWAVVLLSGICLTVERLRRWFCRVLVGDILIALWLGISVFLLLVVVIPTPYGYILFGRISVLGLGMLVGARRLGLAVERLARRCDALWSFIKYF